ncbi:hypothetical protein, partial [Actinoallomurus acaciae]
MADDSGGLSVPGTDNWSEWTFEQALKALTGEGADLHTPAKATFFNVNPSPGDKDEISYHAWGDYYYGVNVNHDAVTAWTQAVDTIDEMMPDVSRGKRGSMDHQTLVDLAGAISDFGGWAQAVAGGMNMWSQRLDSDDSSFRGKAAFLIYWRLKANGDGLTDTYEQVTTRHGQPMATVVMDAANELGTFNSTMSTAWSTVSADIRNWIQQALDDVYSTIWQHITSAGIVKGQPGYVLDEIALGGLNVDGAKQYIRDTMAKFPDGDLTSSATWSTLNGKVVDSVADKLKSMLDTPAQTAISSLAPKYVLATSSLIEITAPPAESPPQPDPSTDGPPDGSGDIPPPDGGGNLPPPDGGGGGDGGLDLPGGG